MIIKKNELETMLRTSGIKCIEYSDEDIKHALKLEMTPEEFIKLCIESKVSVAFYSIQYYNKKELLITANNLMQAAGLVSNEFDETLRERANAWNAFLEQQDFEKPVSLKLVASIDGVVAYCKVFDNWLVYNAPYRTAPLQVWYGAPYSTKEISEQLVVNLYNKITEDVKQKAMRDFTLKLITNPKFLELRNFPQKEIHIVALLKEDSETDKVITSILKETGQGLYQYVNRVDDAIYKIREEYSLPALNSRARISQEKRSMAIKTISDNADKFVDEAVEKFLTAEQ